MYKAMIAAGIIALATTTANAATVFGTVTQVQPQYAMKNIGVPEHTCYTVEVPIYGYEKNPDKTTDILGGAIIGGIIGNNIGNGKGNGAAGAVIGGLIGNAHGDKRTTQQIVGYRTQERCDSKMRYETQTILQNYRVWYEWNGMTGTYYSQSPVEVGDQVRLNVTLSKR